MKNLLFVLISLVSMSLFSQGDIRFNINQDVRLAAFGCDHGNEPFSPDLLFRVDLQGYQQRSGFMVINVDFEYADLQNADGFDVTPRKWDFGRNDYKRMSVGVGYTFNDLFLDRFEFTPAVNYGLIMRYDYGLFSFGATGTLSYKLSDHFYINLVGQFTNRRDKEVLYNDEANYTIDGLNTDFSGFIGIAYQLKMSNNFGR